MRIVLGLVLALVLLPGTGIAQEAACTTLGVNCMCSEPFQMTTLVSGFSGTYYNPNDSTTKACLGERPNGDLSGWAVIRPNHGTDPTKVLTVATRVGASGTDLTMFNALPSTAGAVQRVMRGPEGMLGTMEIGHTLVAGDPHARVAMRYYLYFSPNFQFKTEGACTNTKFGEIADPQIIGGTHLDISGGPAQIYQFFGGYTAPGHLSGTIDCCVVGPVDGFRDPFSMTRASWKGKWWRVEVAIGNATGSPGMYFEAWRKNVTDNLAEEKLIGTHVACPLCGPTQWDNALATALTPPSGLPVHTLFSNQYRETACTGFYAWSHYLKGAWSADTGQRIGAATEMESGGTPPTAPSNLRFTWLVGLAFVVGVWLRYNRMAS